MARRSSQEWQAIIEQQEASGLSVADFCQKIMLTINISMPENGLGSNGNSVNRRRLLLK